MNCTDTIVDRKFLYGYANAMDTLQHEDSNFSYDDLPTTQKTIRLIRPLLHNFLRRELISFEIKTVPLTDTTFTALSYVWGPPSSAGYIQLHDRKRNFKGSLIVRRNLLDFLQQNSTSRCWFWIDAICIDQSNISERGQQVQFMSDIYKTAKEVYVWLGNDSAVEKHLSTCRRKGTSVIEANTSQNNPFQLNEYWKRAWIRQEFILAQRIQYCAGSVRLQEKFERPEFFAENMELWSFRTSMFDKGRKLPFEGSSWDFLLSSEPPSLCSDVLDQIYSILGLVEYGDTFTVLYGIDRHELFWRFVEHFMLRRMGTTRVFLKPVFDRLELNIIDLILLERQNGGSVTVDSGKGRIFQRDIDIHESYLLPVIESLTFADVNSWQSVLRRPTVWVNGVRCDFDDIDTVQRPDGAYETTIPRVTFLILLLMKNGHPRDEMQGWKMSRHWKNQRGEDCYEYDRITV